MNEDLFRKTRVVNINHGSEYDVYCGRPGRGTDGPFGNPHASKRPCPTCSSPGNAVWHSKDEAIRLFKEYFLARLESDRAFRSQVEALKGKTLGCFCVGKGGTGKCHALIIAEWLDKCL